MEENFGRSNPWKKVLIGTGVFGVVLVCGLAAALSRTDLGSASKDYDKSRLEGEAAGLFFTREQIDATYAIPEEENGAKLVSEALHVLSNLKLDKDTAMTEKAIQAQWPKLAPAIAKIEEASKRPHLKFKRDYSNPAATPFPEFSYVKGWVRFFVRMGHFSAEKNDFESSKKYWNLATYLSNTQDEEGILIGMLVRIACSAIIERELSDLIASRGRETAVLGLVESVLAGLDKPYDMRIPLKIENWFANSSIEIMMKDSSYLQNMGGWTSVPNELKYGRFLPGFKKANQSRIYHTYAQAVNLIPSDPYDLVGVQKAYNSLDEAGMKQGLSYTMQTIMMPVFSQSGLAMSKEVAQRNCLFQAVALLKSKADPAAGLPLKGRFALDVDGKPIRLKKTASGWILYSVAGDKVDDGGVVGKMGKGDYVLRLPK